MYYFKFDLNDNDAPIILFIISIFNMYGNVQLFIIYQKCVNNNRNKVGIEWVYKIPINGDKIMT